MIAAAVGGVELSTFQLVDIIPQACLVLLVAVIVGIMAKDLFRGMRKPFLDPTAWKSLQLVDRKELNHNTRRFRFALPHEDQQLGLPVGQHITIKAALLDGSEVMRPYTPTSEGRQRGYVDFVVKVYPQGKMTQAMEALAVGDALLFKGPKGRFQYDPRGKRAYGMLAGGTGITPMYQLAQAVLRDPMDPTELVLIFANVKEEDILMRDELDDMVQRNPGRFTVHYVLNEAPQGWNGGVGFISAEMIKQHLPAPADDVVVLRCGPAPMMKAMEVHLQVLGYTQQQTFQF